jgi:hypothetical protein
MGGGRDWDNLLSRWRCTTVPAYNKSNRWRSEDPGRSVKMWVIAPACPVYNFVRSKHQGASYEEMRQILWWECFGAEQDLTVTVTHWISRTGFRVALQETVMPGSRKNKVRTRVKVLIALTVRLKLHPGKPTYNRNRNLLFFYFRLFIFDI